MIEVRDIHKSFQDKTVLDGLTFSIESGEIYGLLGPNGAGKTTLINILCNLLDADSGIVKMNDQPVSEKTKALMGVVPQEISVYKDLTCRENLNLFASLYGLSGKRKAERLQLLIQILNLKEYINSEVSKMSGGWQRRVNIAVALVHHPSILILDEPTAGLDLDARFELWEFIENLKNTGVTILLTTHQLDEAEQLCSRIGILNMGKIVAEGSLDELCSTVPAKQLAVVETDNEKQICLKAKMHGWIYRRYGGYLTLLLPREFTVKEIIDNFNDTPLSAISLKNVGLEHVYLEVTQKSTEL